MEIDGGFARQRAEKLLDELHVKGPHLLGGGIDPTASTGSPKFTPAGTPVGAKVTLPSIERSMPMMPGAALESLYATRVTSSNPGAPAAGQRTRWTMVVSFWICAVAGPAAGGLA